jgi:hypothetical protein
MTRTTQTTSARPRRRLDADEVRAFALAAVDGDNWLVGDEATAAAILSNPASWPTE